MVSPSVIDKNILKNYPTFFKPKSPKKGVKDIVPKNLFLSSDRILAQGLKKSIFDCSWKELLSTIEFQRC